MQQPIESITLEPGAPVSPALEKRAIQNEGGFLTPYYLFELLERKHGDELDPLGREANRSLLRRAFQQAQRTLVGLNGAQISLERTWSLWYKTLFQVLGFPQPRRLAEPLETARGDLVPISHAHYLGRGPEADPLILLDLHPFGTDLDRDRYANPQRSAAFATEPISRALEFVLDYNEARWALLSNGLEMRLYRRGGSVARQYLRVDFVTLFEGEDDKDWLVFWGLFRLAAFLLPSEAEDTGSSDPSSSPRCLLDKVIEESQRHATRIADDLRLNIVEAVEFLLQGVIDAPANRHLWEGTLDAKKVPSEFQLKALFEESIYFLYRLLFVLYAESRDLLPVGESAIYRDTYSLEHLRSASEKPLRHEDYDKNYYIDSLHTLFDMLHKGYPFRNPAAIQELEVSRSRGSAAFRIPPYNGRLFDPGRTQLLNRCHIPDRAMREVIRELSLSRPQRRGDRRERYSYADLGVDQLGSIYEGLLVYEPFIAEHTMVEAQVKGELRLIPLEQADEFDFHYDESSKKPAGSFLLRIWGGRRKGSGSYYTPQEITAFLVKDALAPLVEPIVAACAQRDDEGQPLLRADEILKLKVCDPAMGSGAFLVQACRYLGEAYGRALIAEEQRENKRITSAELSKYKRRVAELCLYGVDLNPLAVELAKVSLWLETLAHDRPLTFLDAHLRCGNALIGAPLRNSRGALDPSSLAILPTAALGRATKEDPKEFKELLKRLVTQNKKQVRQLERGQLTLFSGEEERDALAQYGSRRHQMEESDEDKSIEDAVALVHRKQNILQEALAGDGSAIRRFKELCDLWCAAWFWPVDAPVPPPTALLFGDLAGVLLQRPGYHTPEHADQYLEIASKLAEKELHFFHWELEFPEVWCDAEGNALPGSGFDAVIGNPPWDNVVLNSKEFWSNFLPTFRTLTKQVAIRAADELRADSNIDLQWRKYVKRINQANNLWKQGNFFTYQGNGLLNTYKLFLERMVYLTRVGGIFSAVTPSGVYMDEGCTPLRSLLFFQHKNRFMLSFENRAGVFPIDSRLKVVLLSGLKSEPGEPDSSQSVACLFLIGKDTVGYDLAPSKEDLGLLLAQLEKHLLRLPAPTIRKLAPDTLSIMEFKSQREIDLSEKVYDNHPLLGTKLEDVWNVTMRREFDMTDDSALFEEQASGWPLWEGKTIYQLTCGYSSPRYTVNEDIGIAELARRTQLKDYQKADMWVANQPKLGCADYRLVYRKIASNTNEVTLIAAVLPPQNFIGNSIAEFVGWEFYPGPPPVWVRHLDESNKLFLAGVLNSFVLNFLIRQKVSANVSMFLVSQLPIPRLPGDHPISQTVVPLVARLTCLDERFAPLWEELARQYASSMQLRWAWTYGVRDAYERAQLRAEVDAIIADLYGLSEQDFAYILNSFPLLDRDQPPLTGEEKSFVTRDLALLKLFQRRGKVPPVDTVTFFNEAGIDIRLRTGPILDLNERVRIATQALGAVAYQPSRRERDDNSESDEIVAMDELDFDDEE